MRSIAHLNAQRAFEASARHQSFSLAAQELNVTPAAVGQLVRTLEDWLGSPLFVRSTSGRARLVTTEVAEQALPDIRAGLERLAVGLERLRSGSAGGVLTVTVSPAFAAKWLLPRLPDFTSSHPEIDLRIVASDRLSNFQTDAVDLAVRLGQPPFGPGLTAELLFEQTVIAVGSPHLIARLGRPDDQQNFSKYPLLHDAHNFWPRFLEMAHMAPSISPSHKSIRFNQTALAIDAAIAGQGLALASRIFVEADLAAGRLARAFPDELRMGSDFYLVSPRRARHPDSVAAVRKWLADTI